MTGAAKIPGIAIEPILRVLQAPKAPVHLPTSLFRNPETLFNGATCQPLVPQTIQKALPHLARQKMLEDSLHEGRRIVFVDGSSRQLPTARSALKVQPQLKAVEKQRQQITVGRTRTQERIYGHILQILHEKIRDPLVRSPVWRITRIQQSADYQYCTIRWTIDNEQDHARYAGPLKPALEATATTLRYELARRLSLRVAPLISFSYEDYSTQRLADALADDRRGDNDSAANK